MKLLLLYSFIILASAAKSSTTPTLIIKTDIDYRPSMLTMWENNDKKSDCLVYEGEFEQHDLERRIYKSIVSNRNNIENFFNVDLDIYMHEDGTSSAMTCGEYYDMYFNHFNFEMVNSSVCDAAKIIHYHTPLGNHHTRKDFECEICHFDLMGEIYQLNYKTLAEVNDNYFVFEENEKYRILQFNELNLPVPIKKTTNDQDDTETLKIGPNDNDVALLILLGSVLSLIAIVW